MAIGGKISGVVSTKLVDRLSDRAQRTLENRVNKVIAIADRAAKKFIAEAWKSSPVYAGLTGGGGSKGYDLNAEFGLSDSTGRQMVKQISQILQETIGIRKTVSGTRQTRKFSLEITGLERSEYANKLLSMPGASYESVSKRKGKDYGSVNTVEWMRALLESANKTIEDFITNVENYRIIYGEHRGSRSGRALMKPRGDNFPYVMPKGAIPKYGVDFVDDLKKMRFGRVTLKNALARVVMDGIKRQSDRLGLK